MKTKASITVEAAVVCPVFIFFVVALIELIRWFGYAEMVQRKLTEEFNLTQYMVFLMHGDYDESSDDLYEISINEEYTYDADTFGINVINPDIRQSVAGRAYTGVTELEWDEEDTIVYITPHGEVYHMSDTCTYIKKDVYKMSYFEMLRSRNNSGGKYYACEKCTGDVNETDVYITPYGNRYHIDLNCNAINKHYIAIYMKDVGNMRCCSKCGGG